MSTYLLNSSTTPALVTGQVVGIGVRRDAVTVIFHNVSVNTDILLSLGVSNPGPTTTPGGEWPYVCPAGHSLRINIPEQSKTQTAVGQYWQGKIWALPINQSTQQAVTGLQPPIGNLWILTFAEGEPVVDVAPSTQSTTQIGQQRVIALPPTPGMHTTFLAAPAGPSDFTLATAPLSAAQTAAQSVIGYAFYFGVRCAVPAAGTVVGLSWELHADILNGGGTQLLTSTTYVGQAYYGQGAAASGAIYPGHWEKSNPCPELVSLNTFGAGGVTFRWRFHVNSIAGAPAVYVTWALDVDIANVGTAPGIYGNTFNFPGNLGPGGLY